ncbi:MAG: outer membrane beta-barrel protein [Verrucomicrobia bacterium]|nr:outer membrane beta-barrel protein [Verrucomicrobiota bacterium]
MNQITGTDGSSHDSTPASADQSIDSRADLRGRILKNGSAMGLMATVVGMVGLSMAQTINPTQPGANADPIPSAQTRDMFRPLMPASSGQNLGSEAAADAVAPLQPTPEAIPDTENGVGANVDASAPPVEIDGKAVAEAQRRLWRIRPKGGAAMVYDDNIFISNTNRVADVIWSVTAGLAFEIGDYRNLKENFLIAEWYGTGYFYTQNPQQNAFNQAAALLGQYRWNKLTGQIESRYQYLTGPDREVGAFTDRQLFVNAIRFNYDYSDKTTFDAEFLQNTQIFKSYLNQYDYRLKLGGDYRILPKVKIGGEGVAGILDVADSPLQYYQQIRGRLRYDATGKLAFKSSAGIEFRQFQGESDEFRIEPVFSLGLEYTPFDGTLISLTGYRDVIGSNSLVGQNYVATGFQISIQQRVLQKFFVGVAFGYENDTYFATESDIDSSRVDNYIFARPSISYNLADWAKTGIFYEYRNNDSNESSSSFYDNRVGVELNLTF